MRYPVVVRGEQLFFHWLVAARVLPQLSRDVLEVGEDAAQRAPELRRVPTVLLHDARDGGENYRYFNSADIVMRNDIAD